MSASFIEHRPHATSEHAPTSHYVIIIDGKEIGRYPSQIQAKNAACAGGHRPVHVARVRHLQDRAQPAHWRVDPC